MSYPECDRFECPECPRKDDCVDYEDEWDENITESSPEEMAYYMMTDRMDKLEEMVRETQRFVDAIERALSAMVKAYNDEEDR